MYIIVIERDYSIALADWRDRMIGGVCHSFEEARELVCAHLGYHKDLHVSYVENGTDYNEMDPETGEILKSWFVRIVSIPEF